MMMPLVDLLRAHFGKDFPVDTGSAKRNDPLVITEKRDYVSVEYGVAALLLGDCEYILENQQLHHNDGRVVDELVFASKPMGASDWTETRRFFFDITSGFHRDRSPTQITDKRDSAANKKSAETNIVHPLTDAERTRITHQLLETSNELSSRRLARALVVLPNIAIAFAVFAVFFRSFSWFVLGLALAGKLENGFARFLAGQGHQAAEIHVKVAVILLVASFLISTLHIISV